MSGPARARSLLGEAVHLNPDQVDLPGALRCTVGVLIPLVVGLTTGAVADGLAAAIGALSAGFASFQGAYRSRAAITLLVGAGMALATFTGALAARADWSAIVAVAAWALVAGMMTSLGQASLVIGLQWCVAVIIVNAFPMTSSQALVRSAMVLAGGMVQTILVVLAWPIRTYRAERQAISAAYRDLAAFADSVPRDAELGMPSTVLNDARAALRDPQPLGRPGQLLAFQALVDEAERIRIELIALARLRRTVRDAGGDAAPIDALARDAAAILRSVATAVLADAAPTSMSSAVTRLSEAVSRLEQGTMGVQPWLKRDVDRIAEALAGQLRSALRTAEESAAGPSADDFESQTLPRHRHRGLRETVLTLRANLSWQSAVFRHAVRLALTLAAAMIVYRLSGLSHGYWIALTALLVLRPDFNSTAVRGLSRIAGTILGAALATLLVAALRPDTSGLAVMFAVAAFLAFVIVRVNYALFSVCVTAFVVFLLAFGSLPVVATAGQRLVSTLIGGALAVGAYLLWPTWESRLVGPQLGDLLGSQADYAEGVLSCFADPRSPERRRLGDLRSATRLARSNAELSVNRMGAEPDRSRRAAPIGLEAARGVIAAARRGSLSLLTLHAYVPPETVDPLPAVGQFMRPLVEKMRHNGAGARDLVPRSTAEDSTQSVLAFVRRPPPSSRMPHEHADYSLRQAHTELAKAVGDLPDSEELSVGLLLSETDELVDAVNTVSQLLTAGHVDEDSSTSGGPLE